MKTEILRDACTNIRDLAMIELLASTGNCVDKGMPIEQVQKLLSNVQIDTTMQHAMVNQNNVKIAHRKFIGWH